MIKSFDALSRKNRIFTDMLCRLICCEIKANNPDETWYDVQLPFYVGLNKGEVQTSGKSSVNFKSSKDVLSKKQIEYVGVFIKEARHRKIENITTLRDFFAEKLFNHSTTSSINDFNLKK